MKYPEYLSAARRHNYACRVLQEKIETYEENTGNEKFKFLVISLYYLSGYIMECSLKFKILEVSDFGSDIEVTKNACKEIGINNFLQHDFNKLQNHLDSKIPDMSHKSNNYEINYLLKQWSPEIRYKNIELEYQKVKAFYNHTKSFLKKM